MEGEVDGISSTRRKVTNALKMDWMELPQDRDQWRALVNTAIYLRVP
jgi:hypothetical protein